MEKKEKKRKETGVLNLAQRPVLDFGKSLVGCAMTSIVHRYRTYFSLFITFVAAFNYRFMYGIFTIKLWVEKGK